MSEVRLKKLIDYWLNSELTDAQADELNQILRESEEARQLFASESQLHGLLHTAVAEEAVERVADITATTFEQATRSLQEGVSSGRLMLLSALAAGLLVAAGLQLWTAASAEKTIAVLASGENAAWESSLPTTPGSELTAGSLRLISGIATIRFDSGAQVTLEAPSHLVLDNPMRGQLLAGSAVIDVPDSAVGFVIETPDGYAVDHGTQFSVLVDQKQRRSSFEVLSGEISVYASDSTDEVRLTEEQSAAVTAHGVEKRDRLESEGMLEQLPDVVRLVTNGRATSIIRSNDSSYLHPDFLMAKLESADAGFDRRSLFAFDLARLDLSFMKSARLRLNLVPSGLGSAVRLPKANQFAIYGITDESAANWQVGCDWEIAPSPENGVLLGTFEVPRSQQRGAFGIESKELLQFLRSNQNGSVTFLLMRQTGELQRGGLVHSFASDFHPEASGPVLELVRSK